MPALRVGPFHSQLKRNAVSRHPMTHSLLPFPLAAYLLFAVLVEPRPLLAQTAPPRQRSALEQRYAQQDSAIGRRDLAGFLATLAPTYVVELRDGQRLT